MQPDGRDGPTERPFTWGYQAGAGGGGGGGGGGGAEAEAEEARRAAAEEAHGARVRAAWERYNPYGR